MYDTEPASASEPPLRVNAVRTSVAARLRLSVRHSMSMATPLGPYPSYMIVCQSAPPASRPEPRLTARSMLSFGTELFFAFWMASKSVGLPAGSPPPIRAATSTFLISLANILPRLASMTAFLCLVVAHFEWPDIFYLRCYPPSASTAPLTPRSRRRTRRCRSALVEAVAGRWPCRISAILPTSPGSLSCTARGKATRSARTRADKTNLPTATTPATPRPPRGAPGTTPRPHRASSTVPPPGRRAGRSGRRSGHQGRPR